MDKQRNRRARIIKLFGLSILILFAGFVLWYQVDTRISLPAVDTSIVGQLERIKSGPDNYAVGNNWLRKNEFGLWEMYVEGPPFEMGVAAGKLTEELIYNQEKAFVEKIRELVPSDAYLKFLKYFIKFFNRDIDEYILPEYQEEIFGISFSCSDDFDFIGTNYDRMLNYHGAHDIGHALQDLMLVGCTSFAANMGFSDSSLIVGRNFDFYINEAFAEDKIVCFVNPQNGYKFTYVTWASFIGVVSGMNEQGLTVTINAGKSDIPLKAATPISLLAREILQYAGNIDEAVAIAKKRNTFVAESLLIGSATDNRAVIIEKAPGKLGVFKTDAQSLVCSNHFQSEAFSDDQANLKHISVTASAYRQERAEELILMRDTITPLKAAEILRDRNGLNDNSIGIGNEKAMAQMISHHSVILQPLRRKFWVSTQPYQFGEYLGYDLDEVFNDRYHDPGLALYDTLLTIPADQFLETENYFDYLLFKERILLVKKSMKDGTPLDDKLVNSIPTLNPDYYLGYVLAGDYFTSVDSTEKALAFYLFSLNKEFEKYSQRQKVKEKIKKLQKR